MAEYIDRREVVEAICFNCSEINICVGVCDDTDRIINIPAADVRPVVRGEWIKLDMHKGMEQYKCSICRSEGYVPECMGEPMYTYCPNCGADMRGENDG